MKIICVDDENVVLNHTMFLCGEMAGKPMTFGFTKAGEALEAVREQNIDIALLDIDMPDMNGLTLAARIKELSPGTSIIFLTGYSHFAADAFKLHASGYLLKPIDREELEAEIDYAMAQKPKRYSGSGVVAQTFGEFELYAGGKRVEFARSKAKEMLAFLIDRQGGSVTKKAVFEALWEDEVYDRSKQKYLDIIIRSMFDTLEEYGIEDIVERKRGSCRIRPEKIDCDMYRFFKGDVETVNSYRGQYMNTYRWASFSEADHTWNIRYSENGQRSLQAALQGFFSDTVRFVVLLLYNRHGSLI